jgi:hypothetical protein
MPVMAWSSTSGLQRIDYESSPQRHTSEPRQALGQIKATTQATIYLLLDFHPYLNDPYSIRLLKDIALGYPRVGHTMVLVSHQLEIPPRNCAAIVRVSPFPCRIPRVWKKSSARRQGTGQKPIMAKR